MRRLAVAAALAALTACGGSPSPPAASPTTATPSKAKPKPKPSTTATGTPTPTVTTPPPPSGQPLTASGAFLAFVPPGEPRKTGADCSATFPDLGSPVCETLTLDSGVLLWGAGTFEGRMVVRLLTKEASGGYVLRYEGRAGATAWESVDVVPAPVVGAKPDGVGVVVRLAGGAATYDLLTWVKGGPLVLRAHRGALPEGRLAPLEKGFAEYLHQADGAWVRRVLAWDGRKFLLSTGTRVPASTVPAG